MWGVPEKKIHVRDQAGYLGLESWFEFDRLIPLLCMGCVGSTRTNMPALQFGMSIIQASPCSLNMLVEISVCILLSILICILLQASI